MQNTLTSFDQISAQIGKALENLARSVAECGRLVVQALEVAPDAIAQLSRKYPQVPRAMWTRLEKVGRGVVDSRVALGCPYSLQLQRLPLSQQVRALDQMLDLALPDGDSCKIRLQDATPEQAAQLIGPSGIRGPEEQAAFLRSQNGGKSIAHHLKSSRAALTYEPRSRKGDVVFNASGPGELILTKADLLDLLRRLG